MFALRQRKGWMPVKKSWFIKSWFFKSNRLAIILIVSAASLSAGACASRLDTRGNLPDPKLVAEIRPGELSREDVVDLIGSPSSVTPFGSDTWYYISKRTETFAFFAPKVTARKIIVVKFAKDGKVKEVKTVGLEKSRVIKPVSRKTPTHGTKMTIIEQLIGNLGRFKKKKQQQSPSDDSQGTPTDPY